MHTYSLKRPPGRDGVWYVCWSEGRRSHRKSTGARDRPAAQRFMEAFVREQLTPKPDEGRTLGEVLDYYRDDLDSKGRLAPSIRSHIAKLRPWFANIPISKFSQSDADRVARQMIAGGLTSGGAWTRLAYLRAAMNLADRHRLVDRAPKFRMPVRPGAPRERWVTKAEAARVIAAAGALGLRHTQLALVLGFQTAKRAGAIFELTWSRVDFTAGTIDFGAGNGKKRRGGVPMSAQLREVLLEAQATADPRCPYVVSYRGERIRSTLREGLDAACAAAGVERFTMHICRHSACSWMVAAGIPTREGARLAGMTEAMFEKVYGKHAPDYLQGAADSLAM